MKETSTTDLLHALDHIDSAKEIQDFLDTQTGLPQIKEHFEKCFANHNLTRANVVAQCTGYHDRSYFYDIISGKKTNPSRDILLILCIASHMNRKEIRRTLSLFQYSDLYPRVARDAIIAIHINKEIFSIEAINDALFHAGEKTLA